MGGNRRNGNAEKGDRPDKTNKRSSSLEEMDAGANNTSELKCPEYEATLTAILASTNKRIDEMYVAMTSFQEARLAEVRTEIRSEMRTELAELRSMISNLRDSLGHTQSEVTAIKESLTNRRSSEPSVAAGKLQDIENTLDNHERQIDYLENQSRRNNIRIEGIPEERGETWDDTERKCQAFFSNSLGLF